MSLRTTWWRSAVGVAVIIASAGALYAYQQRFRVYPSTERYDNVALPPDYLEPAEFVFARLMYPTHPQGILGGRRFGFGGFSDWREGGTSWTQDYPRADRHFLMAIRRLTRVNSRSVEQPVNLLDGDDVFNWPWLAAGEMGDWKLTPEMAAKLRDYLLRGGFLMLDDFWGPEEWARFDESMKLVFPDREVVELDDADPIFHSVYDLKDRYQILGQWALGRGGGMSYRAEGTHAQWQGIYDDHKRVMVAISFNSDIGDSWEWADDPIYPEPFSALGMRIGVNDVIYSLTH
jgi:Domain of unknown function (DUF4159)